MGWLVVTVILWAVMFAVSQLLAPHPPGEEPTPKRRRKKFKLEILRAGHEDET